MSLYVPAISFRPRSICHYASPVERRNGRKRRPNPYATKPLGNLKSKHRRKALRIQNAIQVLYDVSDWSKVYVRSLGKQMSFKLNLVTLTLPSAQVHSDREIHDTCFLPFIRRMRSVLKGFAYVYRIETQANGNIHYHLVTNRFIHYSDLRSYWNKYINELGYVDRCSVKDPNSTDVHKVKHVDDLASYCAKYLSKEGDEDRRKVTIRDWGCSVALTKFHIPSIEFPSNEIKEECKKIAYVLKTSKKYDWCWVQRITFGRIASIAPVIAGMYADALSVVKSLVNGPPELSFNTC